MVRIEISARFSSSPSINGNSILDSSLNARSGQDAITNLFCLFMRARTSNSFSVSGSDSWERILGDQTGKWYGHPTFPVFQLVLDWMSALRNTANSQLNFQSMEYLQSNTRINYLQLLKFSSMTIDFPIISSWLP